jgi:hypothetical protein
MRDEQLASVYCQNNQLSVPVLFARVLSRFKCLALGEGETRFVFNLFQSITEGGVKCGIRRRMFGGGCGI